MWARWNFAGWIWVALSCLALMTGISAWAWLATAGGSPYPLDDTFIHMAIAKNLAQGHWGVTAGEFSNASSSPLYVAILAFFGTIGLPWVWIPLGVNFLAALLLLAAAASIFCRFQVSPRTAFVAMVALVAFLPLPYIAQFGMEHTLHSAIVLVFVATAINCLNGGSALAVILIGPVLMGLRLESAFLIGIATLCLLRLGRFRDAVLLTLSSAVPVLALGWVSVAGGEHFLPNPILLKASTPGGGALWQMPFLVLQKAVLQIFSAPHFIALSIALVIAADAALKQSKRWREPRVVWPLAALLAIAGHLCFANVGWLYRYEVYLIALTLVALAVSMPQPKLWVQLLVAVPLLLRAWDCAQILPSAVLNLNAQQVQMAHFVERNFAVGDDVAAHDIGALAFYAHAGILDLAGLASRDILERRLNGSFDTADIARLTLRRGTRLAIVYDSWFQGNGSPRQFWIGPKLPGNWVKLGEWSLRQQVAIGDRTLSFYAVDASDAPRLAKLLFEHTPRLSPRISYKPGAAISGVSARLALP